jgi:hypothetical protein
MAARIIVLLIVVTVLAGCITTEDGVTVGGIGEGIVGSGEVITKDFDFSGFSRVSAGNAFRVEVERGDAYSVSVTVDDNVEQYLDVQQTGDEVRIFLKPRLMLSLRNVHLEAKITMPEVRGLNFSGATRATVTGFDSTESLDVELSGASRLSGDIRAGETNMDVSGASTVELNGTAAGLRAEASGASTLQLGEFSTADAAVKASGASRMVVNANGTIRGDASGASRVEYLGDPASVRVDTSGASTVRSR